MAPKRRHRPSAGRSKPSPAVSPAAGWQRPLLIAFLAAAFLVKLAVMIQLKDHVLTQPDAGLDTTTYAALAGRVLQGDVLLRPGLYFVSPLYIYFLAGVLAVADSFTAVRLLQIVLGTAAIWLIYVSADEWFGRRAAWCAAVLATLTGLFTFYESLLIQAAIDPFLTAAAMAALALGLRRGGRRWYLLSGVAFGIQSLNRPNVIIPACGIGILLALTRTRQTAAIFAAGIAMALLPAAARNFVVAGNWSPASSHGGLNFYIGNNAGGDGGYYRVPGITPNLEGQQDDARRVAERGVGHPVDDAGASRYFY
jgi:4-amino-4-deoxy-L-arabinose transferase-like glycosyltransferase